MKNLLDWFSRNIIWLIITIIGLYLIGWENTFIITIIKLAVAEAIALSLSGVAVYSFTQVDFAQGLIDDKNEIKEPMEKISYAIVLGAIFIGVHSLVGTGLYIYFGSLSG